MSAAAPHGDAAAYGDAATAWRVPPLAAAIVSRLPQIVPSATLAAALHIAARRFDAESIARLRARVVRVVVRVVVRDAGLTLSARFAPARRPGARARPGRRGDRGVARRFLPARRPKGGSRHAVLRAPPLARRRHGCRPDRQEPPRRDGFRAASCVARARRRLARCAARTAVNRGSSNQGPQPAGTGPTRVSVIVSDRPALLPAVKL